MIKNTQTIFLLLSVLISLCGYAYGAKQLDKIIKNNKLTVIIHKPLSKVFAFTTDPCKTPEWIDSVEVEETNEWPPRQGTIYKNRGKFGPWAVYKVSKYEENKEFELIKQDESTYHVNYTYTTCPDGATKLVYHEWVTTGEIDGPFTQSTLDKLKEVMDRTA